MRNSYQVKKGKIVSWNGLPILPRWFCDDKLSVKYDKYGIGEVQYFNTATKGNATVFASDMWGGMKFYLDEDGKKSYLNLTETETMPYGFVSTLTYKEVLFRYEQRIVNNVVYISLRPLQKNARRLRFFLEFYDAFCLLPHKQTNIRYCSDVERVWSPWIFEDNIVSAYYTERDGEGHIAFGSAYPLTYIRREIQFKKNVLSLIINDEEISLCIAFDTSKDRVISRLRDTLKNADKYIAAQNARYQDVMDKMPVLQSKHEYLNNFFVLAPLYHEALKLFEYPGAIRARTNIYWVWGWDGMSSGESYIYWGDKNFVSELLHFYMMTADLEKGIAHSFNRDMTHGETSMISAQGFYISLLHHYYKNGGDITPYYEFAKVIFNLILSTEVNHLGLCQGGSLVPDYRNVILENGNDISTFNNTSAYCAIRAMEEMAKGVGDFETAQKASAFAARTRENFNRILFDKTAGYYVSSASSNTLEKRKIYMGMELKWDNLFAAEILQSTQKECLEFFERNLVCKAGINVFPYDNEAYDADANQAHCWWPAHSEYYIRTANKMNRPELIGQFVGWIENWTKYLMCPEGINCYADTAEPFFDDWNGEIGIWQAFSVRAWYEAIIHGVLGVSLEKEEIVLHPYSGEEMSVFGLHYKDMTLDIHMKGSGKQIVFVSVNGKILNAVDKIPSEILRKHNEIVVKRV